MANALNVVKLVNNLVRSRLTLMHELSEVYKPGVTRNGEKLIEFVKERAERAAKSETARKLRVFKAYYTLEMSPPKKGDLQRLQDDIALAKEFIQSGCYKYLTVKQAWLLFLVSTEVGLWFFLGETIGKMHFVGYKV